MRNATFKNPCLIEEFHKKVRATFVNWKMRRQCLKQNEIIPLSEKVSAVALSSYVSMHLTKKVDGIDYAFFGDSAVEVPFFSSLNFGLRCATFGIRHIVKNLEKSR